MGNENYCCGATVGSEQQHNQDLTEIYKGWRILEFITFYQNALHLTRVHCATFYQTALGQGQVNCKHDEGYASFAAQTQSFLCSKFSTARLEVLTNLRHAGVFQMSTMVNLGIGFQIKSLWLVQALNLREDEHLLFDPATRGIYKFQLARRWCESEKMSCHATLKNLYEPKMDVILTISFKITAEIEITKHMYCVVLCRRGRVSSFCKVCKA